MDDDWRLRRWSAVYGAMIAAQVMEKRRLCECPTDDDMDAFHEEAKTIAEMDFEAWCRALEEPA